LEYLGLDGKTILEWLVRKWVGRCWMDSSGSGVQWLAFVN